MHLGQHRRVFSAAMVATLGIACIRSNEAAVPSLAEYCAQLVREFRAPGSDSVHQNAISNLQSCPEQGIPLLAELWNAPPQSDETFEVLVRHSGILRDGRLYAAARRIAEAPARPSRERSGALRALVSIYRPGLSAHDWGRPAYPGAPANAVSIAMSSHVVERQGPVPLPEGVAAQIVDLYATLAQSDSNSQVRYVAKELLRKLTYYGSAKAVP